jgi:hypothetical protein
MSADEAQELRESAEKAREDRSLAAVSLTMAVLAVLVAVASLLGHRAHTEEVVLQTQWADKWAQYQAKSIREHEDALFSDFSAVAAGSNTEGLAKFHEKATAEAERYKRDKEKLGDEGHELEAEVSKERHRADRYDLAEVFLEVGLVITSITLLSGRRIFWHLGIVLAVVGVVVAVMGAMVH